MNETTTTTAPSLGRRIASTVFSTLVIVFVSLIWLSMFFRFTALFYAAAAVAIAAAFRRLSSRHFRRILILGFVFFTLLPFDISFRYHSGSPRIMRVVYGLPTLATAQRAHRGEILLGGCVVNGYDPIWLLVW